MVFQITLQSLERRTVLPLNYQYALSSWIFRTLEQGDERLATFLHDEGYTDAHRRFKFYSFSELFPVKKTIEGDRLILLHPEVRFSISFLADRAAESMVLGLFHRATPSFIGDRISGGRFAVRSVEMQMLPRLDSSTIFRTSSPAVVSIADIDDKGGSGKHYLRPGEAGFEDQFLNNLTAKYAVAKREGLLPSVTEDESMPLHFEMLSDHIKEKRIDLMRGQPGYTRVRGYKFRFRLRAPESLLQVALLAGVGEKNAMGFGAVEVVEDNKRKFKNAIEG